MNPNKRVSAAREATESRGETFYPGPSRVQPRRLSSQGAVGRLGGAGLRAWPERVEHHYQLVPTTCFNCESACGLLAYVDAETLEIRKFEGNPEHPGSRGRNCAKGPATLNQSKDPDRILHPLKRAGKRGENRWERVSWDEALDDIASRIRKAIKRGARTRSSTTWADRERTATRSVCSPPGVVDGHNSHTNICSSGGRAGYHYWMGYDRPSPDHENADVILLVERPPGIGALLQSPRAAHHGGKDRTARSSSSSTCASRTPRPTPTTGSRLTPGARLPSFSRSRTT